MLVRKAFIEMIIVIEGEEMTVTTQVASFGFNEPVAIPESGSWVTAVSIFFSKLLKTTAVSTRSISGKTARAGGTSAKYRFKCLRNWIRPCRSP